MSDPVAEPIIETLPPEAPPPEPVADDPEALADHAEANAIEIPDGEKLVPLSALVSVRQKLKETKAQLGEAEPLRAAKERAEAEAAQLRPLADAFRTLQQVSANTPQPAAAPAQPTAEESAELEEIARNFDFYAADGSLDTGRAETHLRLIRREAERVAGTQMAPLKQENLAKAAQENVRRALATTHPHTRLGVKPDILQAQVAQVAQQPGGLEMLANPEAMKVLWLNAYTMSTLDPVWASQAPATSAERQSAPPVVTEASGGAGSGSVTLSSMERKAMRDAGMSESEYLGLAKGMKW